MQLPGRNGSTSDYKYGFNGMLKDDEVKGDGNSYDFGARIYDPRVGRWLSGDPMESKYPSMSTYNFVANSPLIFVDPNGEDVRFCDDLTLGQKIKYIAALTYLRIGSPTFRAMYRDMRRSEQVFYYGITKDKDDDHYDPEFNIIKINFSGNTKGFDLAIVIAHETGHAWRRLMGLDILYQDSPYTPGSPEDIAFKSKTKLYSEYEALHIENIVRAELGKELREKYGEMNDITTKDFKLDEGIFGTGLYKLDYKKVIKMPILIDSDYDYHDKTKNHYEYLFERKHEESEINVEQNENPENLN